MSTIFLFARQHLKLHRYPCSYRLIFIVSNQVGNDFYFYLSMIHDQAIAYPIHVL